MKTQTIKKIPIAKPSLGIEEWHALRRPIHSGWLTQGPEVEAFEREFAAAHGVEFAVATTSCTTALHLSLLSLGIGPGDEVIVPAFTWVATANAVLYCGARPVFADVDPMTYNIDPDQLSRCLTHRTKAIVPVHLFGLCADIDAVRDRACDIPIVEDAACAVGASYRGRSAGSLADLACFSFHPRKTLTTGEGGMVTTRKSSLAERVNQMRNHGAAISEEQRHKGPQPYLLPDFPILGFNYRMTDIQAAVGRVQLQKLESFIAERRQLAEYYTAHLVEIHGITPPFRPKDNGHSFQAYVCRLDSRVDRQRLMAQLQARGISTRPGTHCVPTLSYYRKQFGYTPADFPISESLAATTIALPLYNGMSFEDCDYVLACMKDALANAI